MLSHRFCATLMCCVCISHVPALAGSRRIIYAAQHAASSAKCGLQALGPVAGTHLIEEIMSRQRWRHAWRKQHFPAILAKELLPACTASSRRDNYIYYA